jgi:hypothetical protein
MTHANYELERILELARAETSQRDSAIKYAVLQRLEDELELPVLVKYGDADALYHEYGEPVSEMWSKVADQGADVTLFRIEIQASENERIAKTMHHVNRVMLSIGATHIGEDSSDMFYLWPNDSHATDWV